MVLQFEQAYFYLVAVHYAQVRGLKNSLGYITFSNLDG